MPEELEFRTQDWLQSEIEETKALFNLEEILSFQINNSVQIVRGEDYMYCAYINGSYYSSCITPMLALVIGIKKYKEIKKKQ